MHPRSSWFDITSYNCDTESEELFQCFLVQFGAKVLGNQLAPMFIDNIELFSSDFASNRQQASIFFLPVHHVNETFRSLRRKELEIRASRRIFTRRFLPDAVFLDIAKFRRHFEQPDICEASAV